MKERPILFSAEMVRATFNGRKTQTRRVIKRRDGDAPLDFHDGMFWFADGDAFEIPCPDGVPGDRLWVRETWEHRAYGAIRDIRIRYAADGAIDHMMACDDDRKYRTNSFVKQPSIFMPRWASRIMLEITDVRAQRLQEISNKDARAEGADCAPHRGGTCGMTDTGIDQCAICSFRSLWNSINVKRGHGWDKNPWVWALTFKWVQS